MSGAPPELEHIVREVLRRLRELESREVAAETKGSAANSESKTLALAGRLVTLETVKGSLAGIERLTVPAGAVVTPAVRDELKARRIKLECVACRKGMGRSRRMLMVVTTNYNAVELLEAIQKLDIEIEERRWADWSEGTRRMTQELMNTNTLGLLLTDRPAAAACQANRNEAVRAAVATDGNSAREAVETLDANLLVVDPAAHSLHTLETIVREYAQKL